MHTLNLLLQPIKKKKKVGKDIVLYICTGFFLGVVYLSYFNKTKVMC